VPAGALRFHITQGNARQGRKEMKRRTTAQRRSALPGHSFLQALCIVLNARLPSIGTIQPDVVVGKERLVVQDLVRFAPPLQERC
jgi:hypothetical protein